MPKMSLKQRMAAKKAAQTNISSGGDLKSNFEMFDADRDGFITEQEVGIVMRLAGYAPTETEVKQAVMDSNDPGKLSMQEVETMLRTFPQAASTARNDLMDAFRTFDTDENGLIAEGDIRNILCYIGEAMDPDQVDHLLTQVKIDNNGKVDYSELVDFMLN